MKKTCGYFYPAFFYVDVLPRIMRDKQRLHVLLASTAGVGSLPPGPVDTGKWGLTVSVQTSSLEYPEQDLRREAADLKDILAVIFADADDLDEAYGLARLIRLDHEEADIVIVTDEYAVFAEPLKVKKMIDKVQLCGLVVTGMAGAVPMRKTLEHILKNWKG